ncbi:DNA mismatch endonuclease Vsr [Verrucosispora sp. WMMA2121]|nr:DNA mismatch endonuclease Vsr [Verrucosispora sp. WMMA2121]MCZ7421919.1 DNA mismatch endonuclease Vsr [Verrucosispora sp. WMMA2121]
MPPPRPLRAIDLFCGAGGLTQGLKMAGYEVSFALDLDKDSCATYEANHPEVHVENGSITSYTPAQLAELAGGEVDVVVGGPSCQGFSTAGRRTGWVRPEDERNQLWEHMLAVVAELRPRAFLMENVPGMVYWREGHFGAKILAAFEDLGYAVNKDILLAADYGVPQRRRRLFIVGLLDSKPFEFPEPTHMGGWRRDTLHLWEKKRVEQGKQRHLTVWDSIADLPEIGNGPGSGLLDYRQDRITPFARWIRGDTAEVRDHEVAPLSDHHLALISHVPQGGTWRDIPPHLLPERFMGGMRRTDSTNLMGRLDPRLPAYTVNTQFGNVTTGCFTHPYEDRALSVREGARLQTFPDSYRLVGSLGSRYRQVGNAVPPLLGAILASAIAQQIAEPAVAALHKRPQVPPSSRSLPSAPAATDDKTRARMSRQGKRDTTPEMRIRRQLHSRGYRFLVDAKPEPALRRTADLLFRGPKIAVFVDGCFWHGCEQHARPTKSNTKWWADKIETNRQRDAETVALLEAKGWKSIRVWEHEDPDAAVERIEQEILARRRRIPEAGAGISDHSRKHDQITSPRRAGATNGTTVAPPEPTRTTSALARQTAAVGVLPRSA